MSSSSLALPRRRPTVLADLVPGAAVRDVATVLAGAALVGASAQVVVHLGFTPVPVTGQTFGVLVTGCALGWRRSAAALALYLVAGWLGLPWFVGHTAGWQGPSMGYVFGFVAAGAVCGYLAERGADRRVLWALPAMLAGEVVIFAFGVAWLAVDLHVGLARAIALGLTPFLAGEAVKAVLAAGLLPGVWRLTRVPDEPRASRGDAVGR
ncbi:MAG: biotin transporter BioY [Actinomycetota bacterium]|nr:biotin transporter BioY [Actinomycetota bacterium]